MEDEDDVLGEEPDYVPGDAVYQVFMRGKWQSRRGTLAVDAAGCELVVVERAGSGNGPSPWETERLAGWHFTLAAAVAARLAEMDARHAAERAALLGVLPKEKVEPHHELGDPVG